MNSQEHNDQVRKLDIENTSLWLKASSFHGRRDLPARISKSRLSKNAKTKVDDLCWILDAKSHLRGATASPGLFQVPR